MASAQNTNLREVLYGQGDTIGLESTRSSPCLYDHLVQLLSAVDNMKQADGTFQDFEKLSHFLKSNKFQHKQPKTDLEVLNHKVEDKWGVKSHSKKQRDLLEIKKKSKGCYIQPIASDNQDWNKAGYGFSEEHALYLEKSILRLTEKNPNISQIKYWGKIKGMHKDYDIAYGKLSNYKRDEHPENWEPEGEGINQITFWATNNIMEDWIELPVIGPEHINVARVVKYQFRGNLNASVKTLVPFNGKEKHFLKAQLVRITHNCEIYPAGLYTPDDEKGNLSSAIFQDEFGLFFRGIHKI